MSERNALLDQIQKGKKLKKTVTNDRSVPLVEAPKTSVTSSGSSNPHGSSANNATSSSGALAGLSAHPLFAGGVPKLRSTAGASSASNSSPIVPPPLGSRSKNNSSSQEFNSRNLNAASAPPPPPPPLRKTSNTNLESPSPPVPARSNVESPALPPTPPVRSNAPLLVGASSTIKGPPPPPPGRNNNVPITSVSASPSSGPSPIVSIRNISGPLASGIPPAISTPTRRPPPVAPTTPSMASESPVILPPRSLSGGSNNPTDNISARMGSYTFRSDLPLPRNFNNVASISSGLDYLSGAKSANQEKWLFSGSNNNTVSLNSMSRSISDNSGSLSSADGGSVRSKLRAPPPPPPGRVSSSTIMVPPPAPPGRIPSNSNMNPPAPSSTFRQPDQPPPPPPSRSIPPQPPVRNANVGILSDPTSLQNLHNEISLLSDILATQLNLSMSKHDFQRCMEIQSQSEKVKSLLSQVKGGGDVTTEYHEIREQVMKLVSK